MNPDIQCVVQSADILGEVPLWCDRSQRLWWVDVRRPRCNPMIPPPAATRRSACPKRCWSAPSLREAGGFVLATNHGLYFYDPPAACRRKPSSTPKATSPATA